jgi:hypothetical protein
MDLDMLIYTLGAFFITCATTGLVVWAFKTGQFRENAHLRYKPLEEDEKEL